jgi:hypothetical protein
MRRRSPAVCLRPGWRCKLVVVEEEAEVMEEEEAEVEVEEVVVVRGHRQSSCKEADRDRLWKISHMISSMSFGPKRVSLPLAGPSSPPLPPPHSLK